MEAFLVLCFWSLLNFPSSSWYYVSYYVLSYVILPKNTAVGSLSLLQWIFPTEESNPGLLHCRRILCQLSHQGSHDSARKHGAQKPKGQLLFMFQDLAQEPGTLPNSETLDEGHIPAFAQPK